MIVKQAKDIARRWVTEEGNKIPGFFGAYFAGSITTHPDDVEFPESSDVDIKIVLYEPDQSAEVRKFYYQGAILEVSYIQSDDIASPDQVLGNYRRAGGFSSVNIISDPSGNLTRLHADVAKDFARRRWVYERCEDAKNNTLRFLQVVNEAPLFHDQVACWLFGTAGTTHILLVAGLKNPTVRRRYMAARELLADYGHLDFYETLLELQGSAQMSRECVEHHLEAVTEAFDLAKTIVKTPYRFATDISDIARPISIGGSRELIERGFHREAVYWIVATYTRCQAILHNDASLETKEEFSRSFHELLGDLGITSFTDLQQRSEDSKQYLPRVWKVAEAIIAANPGIED